MTKFIGIVAMGINREIGKNNQLLWHLKEDLKFFKKITLNENILFGRKTYNSLGKLFLPNRNIFVLCRENKYNFSYINSGDSSVRIINNIEDLPGGKIYICGGAEIYSLFLPQMSELYCTYVKKSYTDADTFMPKFEHLFDNSEIVMNNSDMEVRRYFICNKK